MSYRGHPRSSENTWLDRRRQSFEWSAIVTISISRNLHIPLVFEGGPLRGDPFRILSQVTANWNDKLSGFEKFLRYV